MNADVTAGLEGVVYDFAVPPRRPWSRVVKAGEILRIVDLEGQQAVDFLCYNANDPDDRYNAMNTIKVQGNTYIDKGTVLYSDAGLPLFTVIEDTLGRHDTVYGCCSNPNNMLRYGVVTTESCYSNFLSELSKHGLDRSAIVGNVNFFDAGADHARRRRRGRRWRFAARRLRRSPCRDRRSCRSFELPADAQPLQRI